jgi:hypothetical protein
MRSAACFAAASPPFPLLRMDEEVADGRMSAMGDVLASRDAAPLGRTGEVTAIVGGAKRTFCVDKEEEEDDDDDDDDDAAAANWASCASNCSMRASCCSVLARAFAPPPPAAAAALVASPGAWAGEEALEDVKEDAAIAAAPSGPRYLLKNLLAATSMCGVEIEAAAAEATAEAEEVGAGGGATAAEEDVTSAVGRATASETVAAPLEALLVLSFRLSSNLSIISCSSSPVATLVPRSSLHLDTGTPSKACKEGQLARMMGTYVGFEHTGFAKVETNRGPWAPAGAESISAFLSLSSRRLGACRRWKSSEVSEMRLSRKSSF